MYLRIYIISSLSRVVMVYSESRGYKVSEGIYGLTLRIVLTQYNVHNPMLNIQVYLGIKYPGVSRY